MQIQSTILLIPLLLNHHTPSLSTPRGKLVLCRTTHTPSLPTPRGKLVLCRTTHSECNECREWDCSNPPLTVVFSFRAVGVPQQRVDDREHCDEGTVSAVDVVHCRHVIMRCVISCDMTHYQHNVIIDNTSCQDHRGYNYAQWLF